MSDIILISDVQKHEILRLIAERIILRAMLKAKGTGNLRFRDNYSYVINNDGLTIGINVDYAEYLEFGTGLYVEPGHGTPHIIEAKHLTKKGGKGFMKFPVPKNSSGPQGPKIPGNIAFEKDGFIYTQKIKGMKPQPFIRPAIHDAESDIGMILKKVLG